MGPLVSKEQYDRVRSYLEIGKKEAKLASGGDRPKGFDRGYYVSPTIFYDVDNSARIAREEIFGPVATVIPFDDEADAVKIANDTPYGLAAAVWTRDIFKAFRAVKKIRAGIVWVNHMQPTYVEAPWGGYKQSGFGRELGPWGIEEYLETKQVHINLNEAAHRVVLIWARFAYAPQSLARARRNCTSGASRPFLAASRTPRRSTSPRRKARCWKTSMATPSSISPEASGASMWDIAIPP